MSSKQPQSANGSTIHHSSFLPPINVESYEREFFLKSKPLEEKRYRSMALNWLLNLANAIFVGQSSSEESKRILKEDCGGVEYRRDGGDGDVGVPSFQMPLHYPRYVKSDYEQMEEWKVDVLLQQYGIDFRGSLDEKRRFAMGAFLWPDQF